MNVLQKVGFHAGAAPDREIGRKQNLKPGGLLIPAMVLEIIYQPQDSYDTDQMKNEQKAPYPRSGGTISQDFSRE